MGVSDILTAPFFPRTTGNYSVLVALAAVRGAENRTIRFKFRQEASEGQAAIYELMQTCSFTPESLSKGVALKSAALMRSGETFELGLSRITANNQDPKSVYHLTTVPLPPMMFHEPCKVVIEVEDGDQWIAIGAFQTVFSPPPPLLDEEKRALLSIPDHPRTRHMTLRCPKCSSSICVYVTLESGRPPSVPLDAIDIGHAPDNWVCGCGESAHNMVYLKRGMHDALRESGVKGTSSGPSFQPTYEKRGLQRLVAEYFDLLRSKPLEERVQKFLEENPIFWSFLSPSRVMAKPPIFSQKKADFGILTTSKVLYLVEIEKPQTQLTKQSGGLNAQLQAGIDQIRDWQVLITDNRNAFLNDLGFRPDEVHDVRFILIAGTTWDTPEEGLLKLRRTPPADADFYCFDELGARVYTLSTALTAV